MDAVSADVGVLSLAAAADQAATRYALKVCSGCTEGNPWMREPAAALAIKAVSVVGTAYGCAALRKRGHKGFARALRWTVASVWLGLAARAVVVSKKGRSQ